MKKSKILKIFSYLVMLMAFVFVGSILSGSSASATTVYYDANKTRYKQVSDLQEAITSCKESKLKLLSYSSSYCVIYMEEDYDNTSEQLFISDNIILYTEGYNIYTSIVIGNDGTNDIPTSLIIRNRTDNISNIGNYSLISGITYSESTIIVRPCSKLEVHGEVIDNTNSTYHSDYFGGNIFTTTNIVIYSVDNCPITLYDSSITHIYDATIMDKSPDGYGGGVGGLFYVCAGETAPLLVIKSGEMFLNSGYLVRGNSMINIEINGFEQVYENNSFIASSDEQIYYPYLYIEDPRYFEGILETDFSDVTSFFGNFSMISNDDRLSVSTYDSYGNFIEDMQYSGTSYNGLSISYSTYFVGNDPNGNGTYGVISSDGEYVYRADVSSCITISGVSGNVIILDFAGHDIACGDTNVITINETYVEKLVIMNANIFLKSLEEPQNAFSIENSSCEVVFFNVSVFALGMLDDDALAIDLNPIIAGNSGIFSGSITFADINNYDSYASSSYTSQLIENYSNHFPDLLYFQNYFFGSNIYSLEDTSIENSAIVVNGFDMNNSNSSYNSYISVFDRAGTNSYVSIEYIYNSEIYGYVISTVSISNSFIQCNSTTYEAISNTSKVRITNSTIRTKGTIVGENTTIQIDDTNTFLYGETVFASTSTSKIISGLVRYIVYDDTTDTSHSHKIYLKLSDKNVILTKNGNSTEHDTISETLTSASSTDTIKITLNKNITECVTISTIIRNIEFDLNGKTWTCSNGVALNISGGTSNTSTIIINDSSSDSGTITASNSYTIKLEFSGTFNLYRGKIVNTGSSGTIFATTYANTINIGDSSSTTTNLQVLNTGSGSSIVIDDLGSPSIILNVIRGLIVSKTWTIFSNSASSTLNIGNNGSNPNNLKIISTSTSSGYYGVQAKTGATFNFKGGFIGSAAGESQAYNRTPTVPNGVIGSSTTTYDGTTYNGKIVAVAHIGSTYYSTLQEAVDALNSTASSTIVLDTDITGSVTISSTKIGIIDLNGKTWTGNGNALYINGSSNKSHITITDTSSSVGTITATSDTISTSFVGTLTILKGIIKNTNSSTNYAAIWNTSISIIEIGDSTSTISNLQILNNKGYGIYSSAAGTININNGLIVGKTYGIYSDSSSSTVNIGASYSTKDTLQVISISTSSSYYGIYTSSSATFKFNGGFIGSAYGAGRAYSKTPTLQSGYSLTDTSITYDGETINGYEVTRNVVAHIGSTYYSTLTEGIKALDSNSKTLVLDKNITECVTISTEINGTIDLNGKTWNCTSSGYTLALSGSSISSVLEITDNSTGAKGKITSSSTAIFLSFSGTLTIHKATISTTSSYAINVASGELMISSTSENIDNVEITSSYSEATIYTKGTIRMYGGSIYNDGTHGSAVKIDGGTLDISRGTIMSESGSGIYFSSGNIYIGTSLSTADNLQIISMNSSSRSYYGIQFSTSASGTFNFNGKGFIGSALDVAHSFTSSISGVTYNIKGALENKNISIGGTTIYGRILCEPVAHIGSIYYSTLAGGISALTSTSKTLVLDSDVTECVSASGKSGIIDLNGHTWSCTQAYETLLALTNSSSITITDNSSGSVGKMISTYNTIEVTSSTLNIYKGIIQSTSTITSFYAIYGISSAKITIGNSSSTATNLQISANGHQTINVSSTSTLTVNNGTITKSGSSGGSTSGAIYSTGSGTYVYIYKGYIISDVSQNVVYVDGGSILFVGNSSSTTSNLKIINAKSGTSYGVYNNSSHFTFTKGFIGSAGGSSYAYGGTSPTISGGVAISTTTTYNSTTYQGKTIAVAHIDSTYYSTLTEGIKSLNSITKILVLDSDVAECVYIGDTAIVGIINLNGKTWKCTNSPDAYANAALAIYASSSGTSNLTITDSSSDSSVGTITSSSNDAIRFRGGSLTILKGIISVTGTTGNPAPIWVPDSSSTLTIGNSSSNITNLQILNLSNGNSGPAISTSAVNTTINNGLIVGYWNTIYNDNSEYGALFIGSNNSTTATLRIIATQSNTSYYAVNATSIIQFNGGFVGSGAGSNYAFNKTPLLSEGKLIGTTSLTYNSVSYSGKIVSTAAAHIGSTSYATLAEGIKALDSSTKTLVLDKNATACISISTTVTGTIDLNGKTWACIGTALELTGSSSNIKITDNSGSIGSITATVQVVTIKNSSTLYVYKGIYKSTSSNNQNETFEINSGCDAYIGTSSNTTNDLQVIGTAGAAIYSNNATIYIYGGLIQSTGNSAVNFYKGNLYVYGGTIQATSSTSTYYAIYAHPATVTIGNSSSNPDNLKVLSNGGYAVNLSSASTMTLNSGVVLSAGNHGIYVNGGSSLSIGNTSYTSSANLYLLTGSSSSYAFYVTGGTSSANSTANIGVGFLGVKTTTSYPTEYGKNNGNYDIITWTNEYGYSNFSTTYDSITYKGTAYGVVYINGSPNVYYGSLKAAVNKTNSSTVTTIKIKTSIKECLSISTTKKIIFDYIGATTWSCDSTSALRITGSSNYSEITIQNSGQYGASMTSSYDVISLSFAGTLTILGGRLRIETTNTGTNYAAIWNTGMSTINIGNSSDDLDLQILNKSGGYAIHSSSGRAINVNNGLIVGKTYGIHSTSSSNTVNIGASYSTKKTLQIISTNTDSASYGVYAGTLNYTKGFMGSGYGLSNAFKYTNSMTGTADGTAKVVYNSITYTGISGQAVATIGTTKYGSIDDAIYDLDSTTSKTIKLIADVNECVSITTAKKGTIDLNGYDWTCSSGTTFTLNNSSASITIESPYNNISNMTSTTRVIALYSGSLTIQYIVVQTTSSYSSYDAIYVAGGTLNIDSGFSNNYYTQILANGGRALYVANNSTVNITYGYSKIESQSNNAIYISGSSTNVTIAGGLIISNGSVHTISVNSSANLSLGRNLGKSTNNLYIINNNTSTSYYGVYNSSSTVNFANGFIGSAAGASYAYNSVTIPNGVVYTTSYTYNGTTYSGKSLAVAHIGSTYYNSISAAFDALDNTTTKTIVLDANFETDQIIITSAVKGIIDLNGKTLSSTSTVLGIASASNITITNSTSTIGKISSMSTYGGYNVIAINNGATLKILKGIIESNTNVYISGTSHLTTYTGIVSVDNATLIVGDSSSTTSNLQLIASGYASVINAKANATITINNGKLSNTYSGGSFPDYANVIYNESTGNTITINKGILSSTKGYGIYLGSAVSNLTIGNETSTISNLKITSYQNAIKLNGSNSNVHINTGLIVSSYSTSITGGSGTLYLGCDNYQSYNGYTTIDNLQIITTATDNYSYGVNTTINLEGGFIGATTKAKAIGTSSWSSSMSFDASITYNGTTYNGYGAPIAATIGNVVYGTLKQAVAALNSSSSQTIELYRDVNECITISSTVKGVIDLFGYTWSCSGTALYLSGSSNTSNITITDTSDYTGTITATSDTISVNFAGTLNILKGIIKTTNTSTGYAAIWNSTAATINIGDSSSTTINLQILNITGGYAIYSAVASTININNGLIAGKTSGIYSNSSSSTVNIGATYSNSNTLQVFTINTSSYYGVYTNSSTTFNFRAGFIGHAGSNMLGYSYNNVPTSPYRIGSSITYNGSTIYGYKAGYASLNSIYYGSLQYAVNALPTSSSGTSTIQLLDDITEYVSITSTKYGTINLNGHTWTGSGNALYISGSSNTSNITITDTSSSVGTIKASSNTIYLYFTGTFTILKGKIFNTSSNSAIYISGYASTINIGDSSSTTSNLQILNTTSGRAIYNGTGSTININNGAVTGKTYGIYSSSSSSKINIGTTYTKSNSLQIYSVNTTSSYYGVYATGTLNFNCGTVGSAYSSSYVFNKTPTLLTNGSYVSFSDSYSYVDSDGFGTSMVIYARKTGAVSDTYNVYYGSLQNAIENTSGAYNLKLEARINESITISETMSLTINLNGKTWTFGSGAALSLTGGTSNTSTITITDSSSDSSVGTISATGSDYAINADFGGTLNIYKGKIVSYSSSAIFYTNANNVKVNIGNSSSNETNLQIYSFSPSENGIYITPGANVGSTLTINGGLIKGNKAIYAVGKSTININKGILLGTGSNAITAMNFDSGSPTVVVGDSTSTSSTLKIMSSAESNEIPAISVSGSSSVYASLTVNGGLIGEISSYNRENHITTSYTNVTINGELGDSLQSYDGENYEGNVVYAASVKSGSTTTYYESIPYAFSSLNNSTKTIKLLKDYNGSITLNNVNATIDLNGKTWSQYGYLLDTLVINNSSIIIDDTSASIGKLIVKDTYMYAIVANNSQLSLYKGHIECGSVSAAINLNSSTMYLGRFDGTVDDAQILTDYDTAVHINSSSTFIMNIGKIKSDIGGSLIYSFGGIVRIYNGELCSGQEDYEVNSIISGYFNELTIGNSNSRIDNLKIMLIGNKSSYAINFSTSQPSVFNFVGGFIGNYIGAENAYNQGLSNVTYNIYGKEIIVNETYDNLSYPGKTIAVASIGDTYYYSLGEAFDALPTTKPSTYPVLKILGNRNERVTFSTTRYGIVDLNGKTWTSGYNIDVMYITGGNSNVSDITITDYSSSVGSINGSYNAIAASFAGNLKLYKGIFTSTQYTINIYGKATLTIGDSSSTLDNLKISSTTTRYSTISIRPQNSNEKPTLIINNGTIYLPVAEGSSSSTISLENTNAYIYKGTIRGNGDSVLNVKDGVTLVIGNSSSTTTNLVIMGGTSSTTKGLVIEGTESNKDDVTINGGYISANYAILASYASLNVIGGSIFGGAGAGISGSSNVSIVIGQNNGGGSGPTISSAASITAAYVTIYNGTINSYVTATDELTIYGGTITGSVVVDGAKLTMYAGTIIGYITHGSSSYSPTITIGVVNDEYYSSADRLKIINKSSNSFAITMTRGTFIFNRGFIGAASGSDYAYSLGSDVSTIIDNVFNSSDTYNSTTYGGKAIAVAHIGSTKYKTLSEAFDALNNTTTKTIVLDGSVDEMIGCGGVKLILDLNGNIWTNTGKGALYMPTFYIYGGTPDITITDTSSTNTGLIKNEDGSNAVQIESGKLTILRGTIRIILARLNSTLVVGDATSTSNSLRILSSNSSNAISMDEGVSFTYNGGFIGSATSNNYSYTYAKNVSGVTYTINGKETNTAISYDGTTYYGVKLYVAHNETTGTYYETLKDAFNDLSSTTTTKLWLDGNRDEGVSINKQILVEIDLRGYTWSSNSAALHSSHSSSKITITDTSNNVGTIKGGYLTIQVSGGTLNIYKGIITYKDESQYAPTLDVSGNAVVNIGNSESTEENLQIIGTTYAMYSSGISTINIYGGLIKAVSFGIKIFAYFSTVNLNLNIYGGTIIANKGIDVDASNIDYSSFSIKITIGNSKSTPNNLKIVSTSATDYGIDLSNTYTLPIFLVINSGFIGSLDSSYGHTYNADNNATVTINGEKINSTTTIDSTTYYGFFVAVAHIGDTYYTSLQDAFDALNETTTTDTTIVLDGNPNECVSFSTTKYGTVDLNGKTWTCNGTALLEITGGSSNRSNITITDSSGSIGSMISNVENIRAKFGGVLNIYKGNLQAQYYVISSSDGVYISLGNGDTKDNDLVLTNDNSVPAINLGSSTLFMNNGTVNRPSIYGSMGAIYADTSQVYIYKGIINSGSYAIDAKNNSHIYLGNEFSNIDNLKIISSSTLYSTINLENSIFSYGGGFISNRVEAYNKNVSGVTYDIMGTEMNTSVSYDGTTYSGITLAAASIGDTYYEYLQDAFDALTSSSTDTIIKLEKSLAENITAISKAGIVDLNGKSWYSLSSVPGATILTLNSSSSITITSSDSNEYGGSIINNYGDSISVGASTLKVLKGMIQGKYAGIVSTGNVVIGDREETSNNIRIIGGDDFYAIYTTGGTLVVNGGVITSTRASAIYSVNTKININRGIIYSLKESGVFASSGTTLVVGNMESTVNNLLILSGSVYGVSLSGISSNKTSFTFVGGFIGSGNGYDYAYETDAANVTYTINGAAINTTASYDGLSYPGKTPAVAHIGYTYYNSLEKAFNELNESTTVDTTIVLDTNISQLMFEDVEKNYTYLISGCITISTTKIGTIDLNGKTWGGCMGSILSITGGSSNLSNITITDNSNSVGRIGGSSSNTIYAQYDGLLNIYKGIIEIGLGNALVISSSKVVVTIGNENSTTSNLIIRATNNMSTHAIWINGEENNEPTLIINGGLIQTGTSSVNSYSGSVSAIYMNNADVTINRGEVVGLVNSVEAVGSLSSLVIGNSSSNSSNLKVEANGSYGPALNLSSGVETVINSGNIIGNSGISVSGSALTVNGGTITGSASTGISASDNSNVVVNGGTIKSESTYAIQISKSSYSMSGGTVTGVNGIQLEEADETFITGGTIIANGTNGAGIYTIGDNRIEVTDAIIQGTAYGIYTYYNMDKIIVYSGSITGNVGIQAEELYMLNIVDGTITGTGSYAVNMISGGVLMYEGGTLIGSRNNKYSYYYGENVSADISYEEYTIINSDNMYETNLVKERVASLSNGDSYYKLSEAIENAQVGDIITILKDITPSEKYGKTMLYTVNLNKQLTINLNGKTINNYIYSMNENTNLFVWIADDVKIVGTGNIVSYSSTLRNVIRVDSGSLTLGDINEEYSEDLVVTSNFGCAVIVTGDRLSFIYNSGKLVVNSSDTRYSNVYYNYGRFVTRDGYHVEMTHVNNVHTAKLVKGSIINDDNQLEIIYKEVSGKLHIIVKSNKEDRTGKENISLDIAKRVKYSTSYSFEYANNSCEITNKQCETVLENEELAYLYNVTYTNELVIRYVNTDNDGLVISEESIQKDLTISPEAGDSTSIYKGENDIISDGDILLLNIKDVSTINSNMKNNKEAIYDAIFGKHWSNVVKTISDPGDVSVCSISSSSICTNLTSLTFTATYNTSAPQPANGIVFKKLVVYNYAPRLNENASVTQNVVCEYGSSCEASELVFMDYKGNKVENVENVITLNGEVVDSIDTTKLGNYVVTTYAIDDYGYRSNNIVRTYTVVDNEAPVIEVSDETIYVEKGHGLKDIDVKAYDNHDEDVTVEVITSNINFNKKGIYEIVYKATDSSGNTTLIYRTVVVKNTTEVVLYSIIGVLTLIILVMGFILLKRKRRLNV